MQGDALHLAFVTREMPPEPPFGGIGTYVDTIARTLAGLGHRVHVFCRGDREHTQRVGPNLVVTRVASPPGGVATVLDFCWKAASLVRREHARDPFHLVEVPEYLGQALFLGALRPRLPIVIRHHGGFELELLARRRVPPRDPRWYVLAAMELLASQRASMATAVSRRQAQIARLKHLPRGVRVVVIPNPYPAGIEARTGGPKGPPWKVLFVGRLDENKRPHLVAKAVGKLVAEGLDLVLECIGPDTPYLGGRMSDHIGREFGRGHQERLRLRGRVPHEHVLKAMQEALVLCLPSRQEGFPMVVAEAMAVGVPVIGAVGTSLEEIIVPWETGFLTAQGDATAIADAIATLASDTVMAQRMGQRARQRAERLCSPRSVATRFLEEVAIPLAAMGWRIANGE